MDKQTNKQSEMTIMKAEESCYRKKEKVQMLIDTNKNRQKIMHTHTQTRVKVTRSTVDRHASIFIDLPLQVFFFLLGIHPDKVFFSTMLFVGLYPSK